MNKFVESEIIYELPNMDIPLVGTIRIMNRVLVWADAKEMRMLNTLEHFEDGHENVVRKLVGVRQDVTT